MRPNRAHVVEIDTTGRTWRKSTRSSGSSANCVELAWPGCLVLVRTSRNRSAAPLTFEADRWIAFLSELKGDVNR